MGGGSADGTNNFAAGKTPFAIMVALLRDGSPAASWILNVVTGPDGDREAGSGAYIEDERIRTRTTVRRPQTCAARWPGTTSRTTCGGR
jgi:fructose-1,6-bisphosphatase/inositol monophosphatase family enzyme